MAYSVKQSCLSDQKNNVLIKSSNCLQSLSLEKTLAGKELKDLFKIFWADLKNRAHDPLVTPTKIVQIIHTCQKWLPGSLCVCSSVCL